MKKATCPLCGSDDSRLLFKATAHTESRSENSYACTNPYLAEHGDIVRCRACRMIYNNLQPEAEELIGFYRQVIDPLFLREERARERTFAENLRQLQREILPPGHMLDVGCYTGVFLEIANKAGWQVQGIELSHWAAEIARKRNSGPIHDCPLENAPIEKESMDVVTLWDVIEHLPSPLAAIKLAGQFLRKGGVLALSTYDLGSVAARVLGRHYPFLMEMHLAHFQANTAKQLIARAGFELIRIEKHYRTVSLRYLFEKMARMRSQPLHFWQKLSENKSVQNRFVRIGFLGLINLFAKKP